MYLPETSCTELYPSNMQKIDMSITAGAVAEKALLEVRQRKSLHQRKALGVASDIAITVSGSQVNHSNPQNDL